jgi:hypothetical protein
MAQLNVEMSRADSQLRADVWWALVDERENHYSAYINGAQRIAHLLTPIPDRMSAGQIKSIISANLRETWRKNSGDRGHGGARLIMDAFIALDGADPETSRKRKRGQEKVEEVIRMLKKDFPEMNLADSKDILPGLLSQVKK